MGSHTLIYRNNFDTTAGSCRDTSLSICSPIRSIYGIKSNAESNQCEGEIHLHDGGTPMCGTANEAVALGKKLRCPAVSPKITVRNAIFIESYAYTCLLIRTLAVPGLDFVDLSLLMMVCIMKKARR